MGGGFSLPGPFEQDVPLWTWPKLSSLGFQVFGKVFQSIGKGQSILETATLHDTTSGLRVPTVGFESSNLNMPD
jgi:hypothetical protein